MKNMETSEAEFLKQLGYRVRNFRRTLGISQERLAELAKVHPTYVSNIENAKANASIGVYQRLAKALNIPLSQLVEIGDAEVKEDELTKTFFDVKVLGRKEQKMIIQMIKGLLAGMKD